MTIGAGLLDIVGKPALLSSTDDVYVGSVATNGVAKAVGLGIAKDTAPRAGTATAFATGGTITPTAGIMRFAPAAAATGAILAAGSKDGQELIIVNESANSITFAAVATSRVLAGTSAVIAANTAMKLVWIAAAQSGTGAWVNVSN